MSLSCSSSASAAATVRSVFVIAPDKSVQLILTYPMSTGRNFTEILRAIDSLQLTYGQPVATPADWQPGQPASLDGGAFCEEMLGFTGRGDTFVPVARVPVAVPPASASARATSRSSWAATPSRSSTTSWPSTCAACSSASRCTHHDGVGRAEL